MVIFCDRLRKAAHKRFVEDNKKNDESRKKRSEQLKKLNSRVYKYKDELFNPRDENGETIEGSHARFKRYWPMSNTKDAIADNIFVRRLYGASIHNVPFLSGGCPEYLPLVDTSESLNRLSHEELVEFSQGYEIENNTPDNVMRENLLGFLFPEAPFS